jgi:hypothetical protein
MVQGDCAPTSLSLRDQAEVASFVLRLQPAPSHNSSATTATTDLPCGIEIYQDGGGAGGYVIDDSNFVLYEILEVFVQNWNGIVQLEDETATTKDSPSSLYLLEPGMAIPIVYNTDTGFYKTLPSRLTEDPLGFLAMVQPYRFCLTLDETEDSLMVYPYEANQHLLKNPFLLDDCDFNINRPWSTVPLEDQVFLRSLPDYQNGTGGTSTTSGSSSSSTTDAPTAASSFLEETPVKNDTTSSSSTIMPESTNGEEDVGTGKEEEGVEQEEGPDGEDSTEASPEEEETDESTTTPQEEENEEQEDTTTAADDREVASASSSSASFQQPPQQAWLFLLGVPATSVVFLLLLIG